jgi:hypothetical protein
VGGAASLPAYAVPTEQARTTNEMNAMKGTGSIQVVLKRNINHAVLNLFALHWLGDQFQVSDARSNRDTPLTSEHNTSELNPGALPPGCFRQQILIP